MYVYNMIFYLNNVNMFLKFLGIVMFYFYING